MEWIREWDLEDAADLAAALNNVKIHDNLRDGLPLPYTQKDAEEYIRMVLGGPQGAMYAFAIQVNHKAVGSIGITRKENVHRLTAELGYYLAEPFWGEGLVTSAVKEACQYVFANTDILRIFAEPFTANLASCRVLEKAEFVHEGTLRKNAIKNSVVQDMELYALVR